METPLISQMAFPTPAPRIGKQTLHSQTHVPIPQITISSRYFIFRVESNPEKGEELLANVYCCLGAAYGYLALSTKYSFKYVLKNLSFSFQN